MKNYIYVSKTKRNALAKKPWKLIFRGKTLESFSSYNDEDDMFQFTTGEQALMVALRLQTYTDSITIVMDPSLQGEKDPSNDKMVVSKKELMVV